MNDETGERWIVVPNWDRFQHYKDRTPVWLKLYLELRDSDEWRRLSYAQRGLLVTIWMEFAATRGEIRTSWLAHRTGRRTPDTQVEALNDAGFIEFSASRPLALRYQPASPEKKGEEKKGDPVENPPWEGLYPRASGDSEGPLSCPVCGIRKKTERQLAEHLENVHGSVTA